MDEANLNGPHKPLTTRSRANAAEPGSDRLAPDRRGGFCRVRTWALNGLIVFQGPENAKAVLPTLATLAALTFAPLSAGAGQADPLKGEKLFKACKTCHQVGAEARNGIGPHLDGLFGRPAGALDGFKYSGAMKERGTNGLVWTETTLDRYLEKPRGYVPGTRMSYRGMANAGERADVIAYLKALSREAPAADPGRAQTERPEIGSAAMHLDGDPDYGEYLASECVTCHQISGRADGIPSIVGWPRESFIRALFEYKSNIRTHQVMQNMTTNLGNEEIAALAAYFGTLDPQ
jgi:cytochrome c